MPHHVLDIWEVTEPASVAEYQRAGPGGDRRHPGPRPGAAAGRRLRPVRAGGAGGLRVPRHRRRRCGPGWRRSWPRSARRRCTPGCAPRDPAAAARILPSNGRRIVRALEVIELTGAAVRRRAARSRARTTRRVQLGVDLDPAALDERIAARVDRMWAAGPGRRGAGAGAARAARRAHGQPGARLPAGAAPTWPASAPRTQARDETVRATRRFVRRQRSWFRRDPRIVWLDGAAPDLVGRPRVAAADGAAMMARRAVRQGPRHRQRLRDPARSRTASSTLTAGAGRGAVRPAPRASAATACCGSCAAPSTRTRPATPASRVVHGLLERRRLARRDVRQRRPGLRPLPGRRRARRRRPRARRRRPGPASVRRAWSSGDEIAVDMAPPTVYGGSAATRRRADLRRHGGRRAATRTWSARCRRRRRWPTLDLTGAPGVRPGGLPGRGQRRVRRAGPGRRRRPARADAGVRARLRRDPVLRHRARARSAAVALRDAGRDTGAVAVDVPGGR